MTNDRTMTVKPRGWMLNVLAWMLHTSIEVERNGVIKTTVAIFARMPRKLIMKGQLFFVWWYSPRISKADRADREAICDSCDQLERVGDKRYCGACGCPKWHYSELSVKNAFAGHNCPLGKHHGSIPLPVVQAADGTPGKKPCGSCGDAQAALGAEGAVVGS